MKKVAILLSALIIPMMLSACSGSSNTDGNNASETTKSTETITFPTDEKTMDEEATSATTDEATSVISESTQSSTDVSSTEETTTTGSNIPAENTTLAQGELTPDPSSEDTLLIDISAASVSYIKYSNSQKTTSSLNADSSVSFKAAALKKEIVDQFNGLLFVCVSKEQQKEEAADYKKWLADNPDMVLVPESISICDRNANEIIRFFSNEKAAVYNNEKVLPFTRALYKGAEYELFYGDLKYSEVQQVLIDNTLLSSGKFTLDTYSRIAQKAIGDKKDELASTQAQYRIYTPDRSFVTGSGKVLYPSDFPVSTLLIDCIYDYDGGGTLTVTINSDNSSVVQIEERH